MIIRRDNMGASYPMTVQRMAKNAMVMHDGSPTNPQVPHYVPITVADSSRETKPTPPPPSANVAYALNPIQQHFQIQREAFEKERKMLLRKASNFAGESAERVIGDYLSI